MFLFSRVGVCHVAIFRSYFDIAGIFILHVYLMDCLLVNNINITQMQPQICRQKNMFIILMIHVLRIAHLRIAPQEGNCEFHRAASS